MPFVLPLADCPDPARVGGKAAALARMAVAGLPVPPGFVVLPDASADDIRTAYRNLGGPVAVRSSATAEDGTAASFAGQQDTFLNVEGEDAVLAAVARCRASLHTARAVAYRAQQGVSETGLAMAVVVQRMVPATAAGVLFTHDPTGIVPRIVIEAAPGLGEAVVSGAITPDRFALDRDTHAVLDRSRSPGCLSDTALSRLAALGLRVEELFGGPRDIEFAVVGEDLFLLQARPITAARADRERVRQETISVLKNQADPAGTVWVRYNLSEVLPEPTPMTWAVVGRLLAADGGFGAMTRDLGGRPDPTLGADGVFDLVAGRPMANLSKLPRMQFARPPFVYPVDVYRADPKLALTPTPVLNPLSRGVLGLPGLAWRLWRMGAVSRRMMNTFAEEFRTAIAPPLSAAARQALAEDWSGIDPPALVERFRTWTDRTLIGFARHSLKPTVFADLAWTELVAQLTPALGAEQAKAAVAELAVGADPDADLPSAVRKLASGEWTQAEFLAQYGHRGPNEMELSAPRWAEEPGTLSVAPPRFGEGLGRGEALARGDGSTSPPRPLSEAERGSRTPDVSDIVGKEARLTGVALHRFRRSVGHLRTYLGLREVGKHHLLLGYAVVRRALVELDRRFGLSGGVFFLLPTELPDLLAGRDLSAHIADRRKRRRLELSLEVPPVLFSDDLEAIGRPLPPPAGAAVFDGTPVSAGSAEGPAVVLHEPTFENLPERFVLVCPSTDPAWVPLFARAAAVVLETGGVLSHGAIVAREFGLPAVAGLPGIMRSVRTGQRLRVDGTTGRVAVLDGFPASRGA